MKENKNLACGTFRVYGRDGHRQKATFRKSETFKCNDVIYNYYNVDATGTNDYTVVQIIGRLTEDEMIDLLFGQVSDGYFENCVTGKMIFIDYCTL